MWADKIWAPVAIAAAAAALSVIIITTAEAAPVTFALVSDIHLDLAYGTVYGYGPCNTTAAPEYGSTNCDTPLNVLQSLMNDIDNNAQRNFSYMLVSGDLIRHNMDLIPTYHINHTFSEIIGDFAHFQGNGKYPWPVATFALGNNDYIPAYTLNVSSSYQPLLDNISDILESDHLLSRSDAPNFDKCAFYNRSVGTTLQIIVLNTIIWTSRLLPAISDDVVDPCGMFAFLEAQLAYGRSVGLKTFVMSHVPPSLDLRGFLIQETDPSASALWKPQYLSRYNALLKANRDIIPLQIYGHTHQFQFLAATDSSVPLITLPAITQRDGNAASYFSGIFDDETWDLLSLRQRYLQYNTWQWVDGDSLEDLFGQTGTTPLNRIPLMITTATALIANDTLWAIMSRLHGGGNDVNTFPSNCSVSGGDCRIAAVCALLNPDYSSVEQCIANLTTTTTAPPSTGDTILGLPKLVVYVAFPAAGVVLLVVIAVVVVHARRSKRRKAESLLDGSDRYMM